jgi:hypothetical protein
MKKQIPVCTALVLLLLALVAPRAHAQGQSCDLGDSRQLYSVGGGVVVYVGGPVFRCANGTTIIADSAIYVQSTGRVDFIRNVRFNEAERSLTSQYAQYIGRERRLMAQQDVVLTNKSDGTTLTALSLDYLQKGPTNPEARVDVHSGRPRATMYRKRADNAALIDTTIVDADRMQIVGENVFRGWGSVDIRRGGTKSRSGYAEFDQNGSYMKLYLGAVVESDTMKLVADSIDADLVNSNEFKEIRARHNAKLEGKDVDVTAPWLRIVFDSGTVARMVAVGGKRFGPEAPQATSNSEAFSLIADSIDAKTPKQKIDQVIAVGAAYGEQTPDSLDKDLPAVIAKDWVRGDTVQAYFTAADTAATAARDTARVLSRLVAVGSPAASTYRQRQIVNDSTEISVNYLTARKIDVMFKAGEVDRVRAEGDIKGLYLQPPKKTETAQ